MFITSIEYGASVSGDVGCNNGNYDVPVTIRFDTGIMALLPEKMRGRDILHVICAREQVEDCRKDAIYHVILEMSY